MEMMLQLVEQHVISKTDPRYALIDSAAFASKNLYNAALYEIRQSFIHQGKYLSYNQMDKIMQKHDAYRMLPSKVSQHVLKLLDKNWKSFFAALQAYREDSSKFLGRPKLPGYKEKKNVCLSSVEDASNVACTKLVISAKSTLMSTEVTTSCEKHPQTRFFAMG
jgi:transposase